MTPASSSFLWIAFIPAVFGLLLLLYLISNSQMRRALFDFSFTEFVVVHLIRFWYGAFLATGVVLAVLGTVWVFSEAGFTLGLAALVVAPFVLVLYAVTLRVYGELVIVNFRIADHTAVMAGQARPAPAAATPARPASPQFCTSCGAMRSGDARFCLQCGEAVLA
jgi:hypothetical protein